MPTVAHRIFEDPISHPQDEAPLDAYSRAVAAVADRVGPAVVRVESTDQNQRHGGVGSGVIIAGDGLVITNSHVIGGARRVRLTFAEGGEAEAQVLGDDLDTDLALLRTRAALRNAGSNARRLQSLAARTARRRDRQPVWLRVRPSRPG